MNCASDNQESKSNVNTPLEFTCCHCNKVGTVAVEIILSNIICPHCRQLINVSHLIGLKQRIALRLNFGKPTFKYSSNPREGLVLFSQYIKHKAVQWKRDFDNSDLKVYITLGPISLYIIVKIIQLNNMPPSRIPNQTTVDSKSEEVFPNLVQTSQNKLNSLLESISKKEEKKPDQSNIFNTRLYLISFFINQSVNEACNICVSHAHNWSAAIDRGSSDLNFSIKISVSENEAAIFNLKLKQVVIDQSIKDYLVNPDNNLLLKFQGDIRVAKFNQMYRSYVELINLATNPSGSYRSYRDDVVVAKKNFDGLYQELKLFIR